MKDVPAESQTIRSFVSIGICEDVRSKLSTAASRLQNTGAKVTWVPSGNLHVSLAFLGDIRTDTCEILGEAIDRVCSLHKQFSIEISDVGTFGRPGSPRVIWAGISDSQSLVNLQAGLYSELVSLGMELESRPFHPHVTLGRVRSSRNCDDLVKGIARISSSEFGSTHVSSVELMQSVPGKGGARYEVIHQSRLAKPVQPENY